MSNYTESMKNFFQNLKVNGNVDVVLPFFRNLNEYMNITNNQEIRLIFKQVLSKLTKKFK